MSAIYPDNTPELHKEILMQFTKGFGKSILEEGDVLVWRSMPPTEDEDEETTATGYQVFAGTDTELSAGTMWIFGVKAHCFSFSWTHY